jgi:hypothetical protein
MILGIPFSFVSFTSYFLQDALLKDVQQANVFSRLGDVYVAFRILFQCFTQKFFSFFLGYFPPFLGFQN